jgi:hypothetical protein
MRRVKKGWWLIVIIITTAMVYVIGWKEERCQTQADKCRASYAAQAKSEQGTKRLSVYEQASEQQAIEAACEPNGYFCRLFGAANIPTVLLVLVGIGAIWAAIKTLKAIEQQGITLERQTKATEDSAKAALLNAQAYINSERPWLVVEIEPIEPDENDTLAAVPVLYRVIARNKGRTPAEMIDGVCGQGAHPIEDQVPNEERMAPFLAPVQSLTMPDDSFQIDIISIASHPIDRTTLPVRVLYVYGRIRYWDVFMDRTKEGATPYETRWLLAYEGSKKIWYRSASGYSRNT